LPGNAAEIQLAKARAALEEKLKLLNHVEAELAPAEAPGVVPVEPLLLLEPAMPSEEEAAFVAGLMAVEHGKHVALAWAEEVLGVAGALFDELGAGFTGAAAGWHPKNEKVVKQSLCALESATPERLSVCAQLVRRVCRRASPPEENMSEYVWLLLGKSKKKQNKQLTGPLRGTKNHGTLRRILVLVPAARVLEEHGERMWAWLRACSTSTAPPPNDATRLAQAEAEAKAAKIAASKAKSQLKGLQENVTAEVNRRVELKTNRVESQVMRAASPSRRVAFAEPTASPTPFPARLSTPPCLPRSSSAASRTSTARRAPAASRRRRRSTRWRGSGSSPSGASGRRWRRSWRSRRS